MSDHRTRTESEQIDRRGVMMLAVKDLPKAKKPADQLKLDFGTESGILQSSAQITVHYSKEELIGKQVVAVVNFPKKQIANFFSECLVTGFADEQGDIILTSVDKKLPNGAKLS